ncbi:MAG: hypothetical protein Q6368_000545 [Candidatus Baldrarchaeota archaeon]
MRVMDYAAYAACVAVGSLYFTFYLLFFDRVANILSSFLLSAIMLGLIPPTIIIIGIHIAHINNLISREKCQNLTLTFVLGMILAILPFNPYSILYPDGKIIDLNIASFCVITFIVCTYSLMYLYGLWRLIGDELEGKEHEKSFERRKFMKARRFISFSLYLPSGLIIFFVFLAGFVWKEYNLVALILLSIAYMVIFLYVIHRIIFSKYKWLIEIYVSK